MHRLVQVRSVVRRSEYVRVKLWFLKKNIWKCSKTKLKEWGHSLRFPMNWFGTSYFYFQIFSMSELISFFFFMFFLFLFGDKNAALKIVTDVTAPHNWKKLDEVCNCLNFLICFHLCCSSFLNAKLFFFVCLALTWWPLVRCLWPSCSSAHLSSNKHAPSGPQTMTSWFWIRSSCPERRLTLQNVT